MGQAAAHPVEAVRVMKQRGPLATACVADMQGWRDSHEDAHFMDQPDGGLGWASFGVLDGHGGQKAALLAAETLPLALRKATKGRRPKDGPGIGKLQAAYEEVDADLKKNMSDGAEPSGSTTISAGVKIQPDGKYTCYLANAGDSRGILLRQRAPGAEASKDHVSTSVNAAVVMQKKEQTEGDDEDPEKGTPIEEAGKILEELRIEGKDFEFMASIDNKPDRRDERKRIEDAGGSVTGEDCPRVDGNLAVSRGFADFTYKSSPERPASQQKVSCIPELYEMRDMEKGDIIILCCDGIFDVMTNDELVRLVVQQLSAAPPEETVHDVIGQTCSNVLSTCMMKGSQDNMTCMIVQVGDLDYVKLGQEPVAEPKLVKKATIEQELTLPAAERLKTHLGDAAVKKSYIAFLELCKKDGCDVSNVTNIDMIIEAKEEERPAMSNAALTQKERLQKKLEDRKKANPPPLEKSPEKPPPKVQPPSKEAPEKPPEKPPPKVQPPSKEEKEPSIVFANAQVANAEVSEGAGKKKKGKKVQSDAPDAANSITPETSKSPSSPGTAVVEEPAAKKTAKKTAVVEEPAAKKTAKKTAVAEESEAKKTAKNDSDVSGAPADSSPLEDDEALTTSPSQKKKSKSKNKKK